MARAIALDTAPAHRISAVLLASELDAQRRRGPDAGLAHRYRQARFGLETERENVVRKALCFLAMLAPGCSASIETNRTSAADEPVASSHSVEAHPGPAMRLALLPPSRAGGSAITAGVLDAEGSCLYVRSRESRMFLGLMTLDTRWEGGYLKIADTRFASGSYVRLRGSEVAGAIADLVWVQPPDPSCDTRRIWIAVAVDAA